MCQHSNWKNFQAAADEIWIGALLKCFSTNNQNSICKNLEGASCPTNYLALRLISVDGFLSYQHRFLSYQHRCPIHACCEWPYLRGSTAAPGVFCPDFSLAAGAEKARLFRISMTMACNAVTGVAGRPPAKFLVSATSNKLSRQGGTQSWSSKRK